MTNSKIYALCSLEILKIATMESTSGMYLVEFEQIEDYVKNTLEVDNFKIDITVAEEIKKECMSNFSTVFSQIDIVEEDGIKYFDCTMYLDFLMNYGDEELEDDEVKEEEQKEIKSFLTVFIDFGWDGECELTVYDITREELNNVWERYNKEYDNEEVSCSFQEYLSLNNIEYGSYSYEYDVTLST